MSDDKYQTYITRVLLNHTYTVKLVYRGHTIVFNGHFYWNETGKLRSNSYKKNPL